MVKRDKKWIVCALVLAPFIVCGSLPADGGKRRRRRYVRKKTVPMREFRMRRLLISI